MDDQVLELALPPALVEILSRLVDDLLELHRDPPGRDDPVWSRLYPQTSPDRADDDDIRELVHDDVAARRRESLAVIAEHLQATTQEARGAVVRLDAEQAVQFLGAVNDVRLGLAVRIDPHVFTPDAGVWPPVDATPRQRAMVDLVDHLAWVQEEVIGALDPVAQAHYDDPDSDPVD